MDHPRIPASGPQSPYLPPAYSAAGQAGVADAPRPPSRDPDKPMWKRVGGGLAAAGLIALKFGAKAKGLLLVLPKLKLLTTSASMLVSIAAYSLIWGWSFALGFVVLLFVHEIGHVIQLRREGIRASAPMFIPFLGALVMMKELPKDAGAEARVGLAGPVIGTLGCLVPVALWQATGNELFQALAFTGFFLNLFNLVPILPLDGGRAMAALSPKVWYVGFAIMVGLTILYPNPILLLVLLAGGFETYRRVKARKDPESKAYHQVPRGTRIAVAVVYVGLAVALGIGMDLTHLARDFGDV